MNVHIHFLYNLSFLKMYTFIRFGWTLFLVMIELISKDAKYCRKCFVTQSRRVHDAWPHIYIYIYIYTYIYIYIYIWPCAIRSCHNRDMPKISSKYASAHLQWHNLKCVHPTIIKVYIFGKLFLQGIQKWLYFCGRGKSKNIMADQKLKFW